MRFAYINEGELLHSSDRLFCSSYYLWNKYIACSTKPIRNSGQIGVRMGEQYIPVHWNAIFRLPTVVVKLPDLLVASYIPENERPVLPMLEGDMDDFGVTMEGSTVRIYDCVAWVQSKSQDVRPLRLQLSNCVAFVNIEQYPLLLNIYATNSIVVINPPVMVYRYPILLESCALSSIVIGRPYAPAFLPQSLVISERFYRRMRFNLLPKPHKIRQALQDVRGIDGSRMRGVLAPPVMGTARQAGVDIYFVNMLYPSVTLRDKYSSGPGEGYSLEVFNVTDMPFANTTTQLNVPDKQHDRYRLHHVPTTYTPGIISLLT